MSSDTLADAFAARWGDPGGDVARADLIRAEVTVRAGCLRQVVLRRVARAVGAVPTADGRSGEGAGGVELARLGVICATLEAEGDIIGGGGGWLSPTPVRLVALADDCHRVVSSLPSHRLAPLLPGEMMAGMTSDGMSEATSGMALDSIRRHLRSTDGAALASAVERLGGVILNPAMWAGLDRVPPADTAWLDHLDRRLAAHPVAAGATERDGPPDWLGRVFTECGPRWHRSADEARLWRARGPAGRRRWAWCAAGGGPARVTWVPLRADEAHRAAFALARTECGGAPAIVYYEGAAVVVDFGGWLPQAEYRFLSLLAAPVRDGGRLRWRVPAAQVERVTGTLADRLGVTFGDPIDP